MTKINKVTGRDLTGQRFFLLTVIGPVFIKNRVRWLCKCDCGNEIIVRTERVGTQKACRCRDKKWKDYNEIPGMFWYRIRANAINRSKDFSITIEEAWDLFSSQNNKCMLTGMDISFCDKDGKITASLDRINNNLGYTIDNVWWIHKDVNLIKFTNSVSELLYWADLVVNKDESENTLEYTPNTNKKWKGFGQLSGSYWLTVQRGALSRDIECSVSIEHCWNKFIYQNGKCSITGLPLVFAPSQKRQVEQTASLDRVNSDLGYIEGNIQWVHKTINRMKWHLDEDYFKSLCKAILDFKLGKE